MGRSAEPPQPEPEPPPPEPEPEPEPPAPGELTVTGDTVISETHEVGGSPCPQNLGSFTVANSGESALEYSVSGVASWLSIDGGADAAGISGSLAAGQSMALSVEFSCDGFGSFPSAGNPRDVSATLSVSATSGGSDAGSATILVDLRIQDED